MRDEAKTREIILRAFSKHVPGVADGSIEVHRVARKPGVCTLVAVHARDPLANAVAECSRLKRSGEIVRELNGERLVIVLWKPDEAEFIANALGTSEALVNIQVKPPKVTLDRANGEAHVEVEHQILEDLLANADLPLISEFVGWKIHLHSEQN